MTTFALVASPLVGPGAWQWLAAELGTRGHTVVVPELAPVDAAAPVWLAHVARVTAQLQDATAPVLVGHSAAGGLIPLVADRLAGATCLYADAQLPVDLTPSDADDWFLDHVRALAGGGRLPPWSEWWGDGAWEVLVPDPARRGALADTLPRVSLASVEEEPPPPRLRHRAAYLRLSALFDRPAAIAGALGWPVARLDAQHLHFAVDERAVADALEELVAQLEA